MGIIKLGPNSGLTKYTVSGAGQSFEPSQRWTSGAYSPGWPIAPIEAPVDTERPRSIDYVISQNATIAVRSAYGLMPDSMMYTAYDNVPEVRQPMWLLKRQLSPFKAHLVDENGDELPDGHPYQKWCTFPDGRNPFSVWMTRYLKSAFIYDAPALFFHTANNGQIDRLDVIDGSTFLPILDEYGDTPSNETMGEHLARLLIENNQDKSGRRPRAAEVLDLPLIDGTPKNAQEFNDALWNFVQSGGNPNTRMPAYTQVIHGTPFSWWSSDQVWYKPQNLRVNAPYGESYIEASWPWIMIVVNIIAFELGHYRTGNMPEGYATLGPQFATPQAILEFERAFNDRMSTGAAERNRIRFMPNETKYQATKKPDFPDRLYDRAWKNILHLFGTLPSAFGDMPGGGLGGKGFKEGAASEEGRTMLDPARALIAEPFNEALQRNGVDDAHFELGYPITEVDPDKLKQSVYDGMAHGTLTLNDGMAELNRDPIGSPDDPNNPANWHMIVAGQAIYVIEQMKSQGGLATPTFTGKPPDQAGAAPATPDTVAEQDGKEHTSDDANTLDRIIANLRENGTMSGKFYSVPSSARAEVQTQTVGNSLTVNMNTVGKIVLTGTLDKHCGVCPEDMDYYAQPVSRDAVIDFPFDGHANEVEIIAVVPPGLPPKAFLFKPLGGEVEALQDKVGGPMYVREEASFLLDRSLGFMLVPVAFVVDGDEPGAAVYYSEGSGPGKTAEEYDHAWVERAAALDYIMSQQDRLTRNTITHPDDPKRPILIDNGLTYPVNPELYCESQFCAAMLNVPFSQDVKNALAACIYDVSTWHDIKRLVGPEATDKARTCLQRLMDYGMITSDESHHEGSNE